MQAISEASVTELAAIDGVGEVIAQSVVEWFEIDWHRNIISSWSKAGVAMVNEKSAEMPQTLAGLTFVVTGGLNQFTRDSIAETITAHGGKPSSSVSKKTDYVLVGSDPGSKLAKAQELGVAIIDEARFLELLAGK
jgi:DNA ligase (NAD+)